MAISRVLISLLALAVALSPPAARAEEGEAKAAVVSLDAANFDEVVAQHPFVVVEFYAPWCGHCKKLAPEYEKAAALLSKHDQPIVLAKVDANEEKNRPLATRFGIQGFPTLKILRNQGNSAQDYNGPRDANGIVAYLKKQAGPASVEIKSPDDAANIIDDKKIYIVGVFTKFSGSEFENFMVVAEKLRADYEFGHTLRADHLPRGDTVVQGSLVRLFKPFDELVIDSNDFDVSALEKFIEVGSMPKVITFDKNPENHPYLLKFFQSSSAKAMLFLNFSTGPFESFKSAYYGAAEEFKDKDIKFMIGDLEASQGAFQFYGLKEDQAPVLLIQGTDAKFFKPHIKNDQIVSWLKEYFDGNVAPFRKSETIPKVNDEPVKVVVADSLNDMVFNSGKNVLLEFYAPWCGHCKNLAPILVEAATSLQSDEDVIVAIMDASANDVPKEFDVRGYPTMYFVSASGKIVFYDGDRTAREIIDFIKKNKDTATPAETMDTATSEPAKDEL